MATVSKGIDRKAAVRLLILDFLMTDDDAEYAVYLADTSGGRHEDECGRFAIDAVPTRRFGRDGNVICRYDITPARGDR